MNQINIIAIIMGYLLFRISLTSMTQICEVREEASPVRRMLYPRSSPAGQGIRWDWLGDRFSEWNEYSMDAQIAIEKAWSSVRILLR